MAEFVREEDVDSAGYTEYFEANLTESPEEDDVGGTAATIIAPPVVALGRTGTFFRRKAALRNGVGDARAATIPDAGLRVHVHCHDEGRTPKSIPQPHRRVLSTGDLRDGVAVDLPATAASVVEAASPASDCLVQWIAPDGDNGDETSKALYTLPPLPGLDNHDSSHSNSSYDDDCSSVGSVAYFEPSDFDSSTWKRVVNDASTVGLVVVALATAITHPFLFLAGAVTALGTATAAHHHRGYGGGCAGPATAEGSSSSSSSWRSWFCFDSPVPVGGENAEDTEPDPTKSDAEKAEPPDNAKVGQETSDDATAECSKSAGTDEAEGAAAEAPTEASAALKPPDEAPAGEVPSKPKKKLSKEDQPAWLEQHYPPLKNTVVKDGGALVGLNVLDFFHVFFDDDAPYNFNAFQTKRGDIDIKYGSWEPRPPVGSISMFAPSSPEAVKKNFPPDMAFRSLQMRTLNFKAKTNAFFGPPFATTTKTQRFLIVNKRLGILESKTVLSEILYSDRFHVTERWIVTAEKVDNRYTTHVNASCEAIFSQSCPFEHQINVKSTSTIAEMAHSWCAMASEAIKLTEQNKLDRLQRTVDDEDDDDDETDCDPAQQDADDEVPASAAEDAINARRECSDDGVEVVADASLASEKNFFVEAPLPMKARSLHLATPTRRSMFGNKRRSVDDDCTEHSF